MEQHYLKTLSLIQDKGYISKDRTGVGTKREQGAVVFYNLAGGHVPLFTTKKVILSSVIKELVWIIRGETNIKTLGCGIWDQWADENGDLGPVYGKQWRNVEDTRIITKDKWTRLQAMYESFGYELVIENDTDVAIRRNVDQLQRAIDLLKNDPDSRRIIVNSWNVSELEDMALSPCHCFFQFFSVEVSAERRLHQYQEMLRAGVGGITPLNLEIPSSEEMKHAMLDNLGVPRRELQCILYQRSGDMFLGVPFNVASYSLLTILVAKLTGHMPGMFMHVIGDAHIYLNHQEQVAKQLSNQPILNPVYFHMDSSVKGLEDVKVESFIQSGTYIHHPAIKAPVAV